MTADVANRRIATGLAPSRERQDWIDVARGVGIILVVFGHVLRGLVAANVPHPEGLVRLIDFTIYTFHMPLFFALSGMWLGQASSLGRKPFLERRLLTVAYPYVLWSLIQGGIVLALGARVNSPITPGDLLMIWIRPIGQFWFLYVLMACHIAGALLVGRNRIMLSVAALLFVSSSALPGVAQQFAHQFLFYVLGAVLGPRLVAARKDRRTVILTGLAATIAFVPLCVGALALSPDPEGPWALGAALSGVTAVVCLSILLKRVTPLIFLGGASMTIYVLHILAAAGTRVLLSQLGIDPGFAAQVALGTIVGVGAPALAHVIGQRLGLLPLFGLAAPRKNQPLSQGASHG